MPGLLVLAAAGLAWSGGVGAPRDAAALTNCTTASAALDASEQELLRLINEFRAANGFAALKPSPNLSRAAAWMAEDGQRNGGFRLDMPHYDWSGRSVMQRVRDCGYSGSAGENLAWGFSSATSVLAAWQGSPGHRANLLNGFWTVIGVGRAGSYWVVSFGAVDDSNQPWDDGAPPAPTATPTPTRTPTPAAAVPPSSPGGSGGNTVASPPASDPPGMGSTLPSSRPDLPRRVFVPNLTAER